MVRRFLVCLLIGLSATVVLSACAGSTGEAPGTPTVPSSGQPDESRTDVELAVLEALDYDARPKAARYEPEAETVVVTVFSAGEEIPAAELQAYESAAEQASGGLDIVVEVSADDAPEEN
ncbi:hypothetical protein ACN27F_05865 [Solwaraspora sp. WMMB335]|uniref:hypothetical protein n=1 Tax=Solwaraspora sp. WMMB335 TaxID=3404118 RepID=UPI003B9474C7